MFDVKYVYGGPKSCLNHRTNATIQDKMLVKLHKNWNLVFILRNSSNILVKSISFGLNGCIGMVMWTCMTFWPTL